MPVGMDEICLFVYQLARYWIRHKSQQKLRKKRERREEDYGVVSGDGKPPKGGKWIGVAGEVIG